MRLIIFAYRIKKVLDERSEYRAAAAFAVTMNIKNRHMKNSDGQSSPKKPDNGSLRSVVRLCCIGQMFSIINQNPRQAGTRRQHNAPNHRIAVVSGLRSIRGRLKDCLLFCDFLR